jgi:hypothetical protein
MGRDAASCPQRSWSPPAPLLTPSTSNAPLARSPAIVADAGSLYVVGNDLPFNDQPVKVGETLTAWRVGHGSIGAPASDLVFISPKATLDAAGRLHLLWAEPPTHGHVVPPYQWMLQRTSSLWTAAYEPQRGWSAPTRVYAGRIDWSRLTSGDITRGAHDESLAAVPNEDGGALVLVLHNGEWTVTAIPGRTQSVYVSVLGLADRRLLAVVTADTTQAQDRNSVFLYGQDGDGPWRPLKQVQRSGTQAAMEIRLLKGPGTRVHLVWRQMIREDSFVIRHVQSDDGGASFSESSDLASGGLIQNVQAAVDMCGRLHVVYEDWEDGMNAVRIGYASWDGAWSKPQRIHPTYTAGELALFSRVDGTLLLAFLGTTGSATDRDGWAMRYSEFR